MTSYILETKPYDTVNNVTVQTNFASGLPDEGYLGTTLPYSLRLRDSFTHEVSVFGDNIPGDNQASLGSLVLNNADGRFDYLIDYAWGGREIIVKTAPEGSMYGTYTTIFTGSAIDIAADTKDITISLRDNSWKLVTPLQKNKYLGTGEKEGGRDIQGQPKPLAFGLNKNLSPVLVDNVFLTYQCHDGPIVGVLAVYDDGVLLFPGQDYPNYAAMAGATIPKGAYATCLAEGFICFGAPPAGTVTMDVQGQFYSAVNLSETVRQMLLARTTLTTADLTASDFTEFATDLPGRISGIYYQAPTDDVGDVLETLLGTGNAFWFFSATGLLRVRQFKFRTPVASVRAEDITGLQKAISAKPVYSVVMNYARNLTVQDVSDFTLESNTLNGYLDDEVVYVQTNADGTGGDWSNVTTIFHAFLGNTEINPMRVADFQEVSPKSWVGIDPDGKVYITDPGVNADQAELRVSMNNYAQTATLRVRKILGPSGKWAKLTSSDRIFQLNFDDTAVNPAQTITVTASGNFTTPLTWDAYDSQGFPVTLTGTGNTRTIAMSALKLSAVISSVTVVVTTNEGIQAVKKLLVARAGQTLADLAVAWSNIADDGGKPEDNATVGAPVGTPVGTRLAEQVIADLDINAAGIISQALRQDDAQTVLDARTFVDGQPINNVFATFRNDVSGDISSLNTFATLLGAKNAAGTAWVLNLETTKVSDDVTMAQQLTELGAADASANAKITDLQEVVIGDGTTDVRALVTLSNNGYISGTFQTNNGTTAVFGIVADEFIMVDPDGANSIIPIQYYNGQWRMTNVYIDKLEVGSVETGNIATAAVTQTRVFTSSDTLIPSSGVETTMIETTSFMLGDTVFGEGIVTASWLQDGSANADSVQKVRFYIDYGSGYTLLRTRDQGIRTASGDTRWAIPVAMAVRAASITPVRVKITATNVATWAGQTAARDSTNRDIMVVIQGAKR